MFQGCPEHDFFSQPQLKFPMFVFSFTMFGVKDELLGRWCSQWQSVCFETRRTISGLCWSYSMWWTLVQVLLLPWTFLGALVKSLHVRLRTGIVVLQCLILQHLFCIWLKKSKYNTVGKYHLFELHERGSAWLDQLESKSIHLHFFYSFHTGVHQCCSLKSHPLRSLTTLDLALQFRSTIHSPFPVSYLMTISHK